MLVWTPEPGLLADGRRVDDFDAGKGRVVGAFALRAVVVPDVVGMGLRDALYLLENRRIRVSVNGIGKVKKQSVRPGTPVAKSPSVTLELG